MKEENITVKENRTPQEILEIREFVLESRLYMIKMSFYVLISLSSFLYFVIAYTYFKEQIEFARLALATIFYIAVVIFAISAYLDMHKQQNSIKNLKSIFDADIPNEEENSKAMNHTYREKRIRLSRTKLQSSLEAHVDKIFNNELETILITSDDEIEVEAVMISTEDYEYLSQQLNRAQTIHPHIFDETDEHIKDKENNDVKQHKQ